MPEWLRNALQSAPPISSELLFARTILSLLLGFVVAGVYRVGLPQRRGDAPALTTTLVLLTILISLVTIVIGDNMARAFGLVGALSIVRFRTVVEDTRDTAFVIFAVVVGMAVGAGYPVLAAIGIPGVAIAAVVMRFAGGNGRAGAPATLVVRIGLGHDPESLLAGVFAEHLVQATLTAAGTARQGAVIELTYAVRLKRTASTVAVVAELNRVEGVQGVELRRL